MRLNLKLIGRVPSKKNSKIVNRKTGRIFPSKSFSEWHESQYNDLIAQNIGQVQGVRWVKIDFIFGDKRRCDLTNKAESIMDLLVDCGILEDDSWSVVPMLILCGDYSKGVFESKIAIEFGVMGDELNTTNPEAPDYVL